MENRKNAASGIICWALIISLGYAVLRYHVMGPVPWKDFPFFVLNKGISLASLIILTLNFALGPAGNLGIKVSSDWLQARPALGMVGFLMALIHVLMSILLFNPVVYPVFFDINNTLTLAGGLSMLGGLLAFVVLWGYNLSFQTLLKEDEKFIRFITSRRFLLSTMLLVGVHLFFMGYKGWMNPGAWHGGLPPVSLLSFVIFALGYFINLLGRK